jgi:HSP90 family molecular chaperone
LGRGTEITMFLKEDAYEFTKQEKIEELIQRYSEFITFPIKLYKKTEEIVDAEEEEEDDDSEDESEDGLEVSCSY